MKKYIIIGSVAVFVLAAVTVFALQQVGGSDAGAAAAQPEAAASDCSGCVTSSGCGSSSGGCGQDAAGSTDSGDRIEQIKAYLLDYYTTKRGLTGVTVEVQSLGCHEEATISQNGKLVEKLSINGNRITKLES